MKITVTGWNSIEELVKIKKINFSKVNILYSKLNRGENFFRMKKFVMRERSRVWKASYLEYDELDLF